MDRQRGREGQREHPGDGYEQAKARPRETWGGLSAVR